MWSEISVLSEDEVFIDTFSVNTLVRIENNDPNSVSVFLFIVAPTVKLSENTNRSKINVQFLN